ncbi:MAG TPA: hypothetical protein VLX58_08875 [Bryobacteraceae bacterium]|nr:hypothetical protein [Bryobacteraceae bacterium]
MNRRNWILTAPLLHACARRARSPVFPPTVAGVWQLKSSQRLAAETAPDLVRAMGTRGWWRAAYEGAGSATVELYELTSSAGGLEIVQKWRPVANAVVWYTPGYFVVVRWNSDNRSAVTAFIHAIQKEFAGER